MVGRQAIVDRRRASPGCIAIAAEHQRVDLGARCTGSTAAPLSGVANVRVMERSTAGRCLPAGLGGSSSPAPGDLFVTRGPWITVGASRAALGGGHGRALGRGRARGAGVPRRSWSVGHCLYHRAAGGCRLPRTSLGIQADRDRHEPASVLTGRTAPRGGVRAAREGRSRRHEPQGGHLVRHGAAQFVNRPPGNPGDERLTAIAGVRPSLGRLLTAGLRATAGSGLTPVPAPLRCKAATPVGSR